ncbi:uncharacterized protein LOC123873300 [Maniola jurtina]|uniref:uncharacterized protein LOC123873300 n=1 Tax=Maniola jurtina TaxID=191418 RepID=UPI001E6899AB|nr:uncharacterized protein LOC123873300 [Maniola jurtina]
MCKIEIKQDAVVTKSIEVLEPTKYSSEISLRKHSCCVTLRTGCLIFAYLYLVFTVGIGLFYIKELVTLVVYTIIPKVPVDYPRLTNALLVLISISIALALIAIPFTILLIIGLHSERRSFMIVYFTFQFTNFMLTLVVGIVTMTMGNYCTPTGIGISAVAYCWFHIYYLLVIKIQYDTMGETTDLPEQLYHFGHIPDISLSYKPTINT